MALINKELEKQARQISELFALLNKIAGLVRPIPGLPGLKKTAPKVMGKGFTGEQKMNHSISMRMRPDNAV